MNKESVLSTVLIVLIKPRILLYNKKVLMVAVIQLLLTHDAAGSQGGLAIARF